MNFDGKGWHYLVVFQNHHSFTENQLHYLVTKDYIAAVLMDGSADLARETQDLRVVVVPEINAGAAALAAGLINPAIGLGTFLAQLALRGPLTEAATREFRIDGGWAEPRITRVTARNKEPAVKVGGNP